MLNSNSMRLGLGLGFLYWDWGDNIEYRLHKGNYCSLNGGRWMRIVYKCLKEEVKRLWRLRLKAKSSKSKVRTKCWDEVSETENGWSQICVKVANSLSLCEPILDTIFHTFRHHQRLAVQLRLRTSYKYDKSEIWVWRWNSNNLCAIPHASHSAHQILMSWGVLYCYCVKWDCYHSFYFNHNMESISSGALSYINSFWITIIS